MKNNIENEEKFEVIYDGKPVKISHEDAKVLIQKGMNYERIFERLKALEKENEEIRIYKDKIDEIADELSISPDKFLASLDNERKEENIKEYSKNNNMPYEYAKVIKELEGKIGTLEKEKENLTPIKKRQDELKEFKKVYPDVDERDIDPEIIKEWEKGKRSLFDIYNEMMYKKMLQEKNANKANEENKNATMGSVKGIEETEKDYTDEDIRKMSDNEFKKNFKDILKQYKKGEK